VTCRFLISLLKIALARSLSQNVQNIKWHILCKIHSAENGVRYLANAPKEIWGKNWPEIYRMLVNKPAKFAQKKAIFCEADTFL
jgi:hypothetical protein